ncbi:hypothetical protein CALVIDRAFT_539173, partial [Calocera viscosa TUFC12733]
MADMHKIPNPHKYGVCSSAGGELDAPLYTGNHFDLPTFEDIGSFHAWLRDRMGRHWPVMQPRVQSIFTNFEGAQPVFSHGGLSPDNIMICDGRLSVLIDWETAGWMPPYWDYVCARWDHSEVFVSVIRLAVPEHNDRDRYNMRVSAGVCRGGGPKKFLSFEEAVED